MSLIDQLERLLETTPESALLRFSLGNACLQDGRSVEAVAHLRRAVELDPQFSAAWKILGKALAEAEDGPGAAEAYRTGIEVAERKGDIQAAKEMRVFLRRLDR